MTSTPISQPLADLLVGQPGPDAAAAESVGVRAANVLRPQGAFRRLDEVAVWLAGWQATDRPAVNRPHVLVFAADHGVAADGVSAYPAEITGAMLDAVQRGGATISVMARAVGADLDVFDVGVGRPTGNLRVEPAMGVERFAEAVAAGVAAVGALSAETDLLVVGELGIGNTTAAAAVAAAVHGGCAADWVGPGTGVADDALINKRRVVDEALERVRALGDVGPLELLAQLGGTELVAMAAAVAAARHRRLPVILDGYICTAAVSPLAVAVEQGLSHCIAGHCSAEPGHQRLLDTVGLDPLLSLDLRLGEGTGAVAAIPLVRLAAASVVEVATFAEWGVA